MMLMSFKGKLSGNWTISLGSFYMKKTDYNPNEHLLFVLEHMMAWNESILRIFF